MTSHTTLCMLSSRMILTFAVSSAGRSCIGDNLGRPPHHTRIHKDAILTLTNTSPPHLSPHCLCPALQKKPVPHTLSSPPPVCVLQTKPVHVYRLCSEGTVEDRIQRRAEQKLYLDQVCGGEGKTGHLLQEELLPLYRCPLSLSPSPGPGHLLPSPPLIQMINQGSTAPLPPFSFR